jgi:hypothetical protein
MSELSATPKGTLIGCGENKLLHANIEKLSVF